MKKRNRVHHLIDGEILTDADFERMSDEFTSRDFDLSKLTRLPGRPLMGKAVAQVVPVRIEPAVVKSIDRRAKKDGTTRSDIIRQAINSYLAG